MTVASSVAFMEKQINKSLRRPLLEPSDMWNSEGRLELFLKRVQCRPWVSCVSVEFFKGGLVFQVVQKYNGFNVTSTNKQANKCHMRDFLYLSVLFSLVWSGRERWGEKSDVTYFFAPIGFSNIWIKIWWVLNFIVAYLESNI